MRVMRVMRVTLFRFAALVTSFVLLMPTQALAGLPDITFYGQGSGHGVGLSQYGAKGMAIGGASYQEILYRYYTDSSLQNLSVVAGGSFLTNDAQPVWVGLLQGQSQISFQLETGSANLCFDQSGGCVAVAQPGEAWSFGLTDAGECSVSRRSVSDGQLMQVGPSGACLASVQPGETDARIRVPRKARLYSSGILRFRPANDDEGLHLVFQTDLETYVAGLAVVPETWPVEAMNAQVVASRSLAAWSLIEAGSEQSFNQATRDACHCNIRDDRSDQVYRGHTGELDHPKWVGVSRATVGEVITVSSALAYTPFFHSSAGWTENHEDVFSDLGYLYLQSINDAPGVSDLVANPIRYWGHSVALSSVATLFSFSWVNDVQVAELNPSGSVRSVAISGIRSGRPAVDEISGVNLRTALGLPSAVFEVIVNMRFTDVASGHPFSGEVMGLLELGITRGCTPTAFCPEAPVTRGEMAAFLVRTLDIKPVTGFIDSFYDDDGSLFEADIEVLRGHGITNGCTATEFCPTETVTRGEMAAFLVRAFDLPLSTGDSFSDDDDSVFQTEIESLVASGVTSGCSLDRFCPSRPVTRGEMAAFLVRALALT